MSALLGWGAHPVHGLAQHRHGGSPLPCNHHLLLSHPQLGNRGRPVALARLADVDNYHVDCPDRCQGHNMHVSYSLSLSLTTIWAGSSAVMGIRYMSATADAGMQLVPIAALQPAT